MTIHPQVIDRKNVDESSFVYIILPCFPPLSFIQTFANANGNTMEPVAPILARTGQGRDNLSGFARGDNNALSHRDKAVINKLYDCAGKRERDTPEFNVQILKVENGLVDKSKH